MMHSAIYHGWLEHRRAMPRPHAFRYRLFMLYLDLDELDQVFAGRWLWSARRAAVARFDRRDHLGDPAVALADAVRDLVAERIGRRPAGPVRLLTHLRYLGLVFNPVSFYYCFDRAGTGLEAIVAEVHNTPWGERHCYVLDAATEDGAIGSTLRAASEKAMHVSPFCPMGLAYNWHFRLPADRLAVRMALTRLTDAGAGPAQRPLFDAILALRRAPIGAASLARALLQFPPMSFKVLGAIYWQALRLWLKRTPVYAHPAKRVAVEVGTGSEVSNG
jgi:uncharacterized protein